MKYQYIAIVGDVISGGRKEKAQPKIERDRSNIM